MFQAAVSAVHRRPLLQDDRPDLSDGSDGTDHQLSQKRSLSVNVGTLKTDVGVLCLL